MSTNILKQVDGLIATPTLKSLLELAGRIAFASLFIPAGWSKIQNYDGMAGYMESAGVPGGMLPLVIIAELFGGIALLIGFQTRLASVGLAVFTILAAVLFHGGDEMVQGLLYMKNITIAGGLAILAAHGAGRFSLDAKLNA